MKRYTTNFGKSEILKREIKLAAQDLKALVAQGNKRADFTLGARVKIK